MATQLQELNSAHDLWNEARQNGGEGGGGGGGGGGGVSDTQGEKDSAEQRQRKLVEEIKNLKERLHLELSE